jgi:hypothetical protein
MDSVHTLLLMRYIIFDEYNQQPMERIISDEIYRVDNIDNVLLVTDYILDYNYLYLFGDKCISSTIMYFINYNVLH